MSMIADQPIQTLEKSEPQTIDFAELAYAIADVTCVLDYLGRHYQTMPASERAALGRLRDFVKKIQSD
jgi:hypothetical protein